MLYLFKSCISSSWVRPKDGNHTTACNKMFAHVRCLIFNFKRFTVNMHLFLNTRVDRLGCVALDQRPFRPTSL